MCPAITCGLNFETWDELSSHCSSKHAYLCDTCRKRIASVHLLDLHVLETHDTLFQLMAEKKPMVFHFLAFVHASCEIRT